MSESRTEQVKKRIYTMSHGSIEKKNINHNEVVGLLNIYGDVEKAATEYFKRKTAKTNRESKSRSKSRKSRFPCCGGDPGTEVVQEFSAIGGGNLQRIKTKTKKIKYKEKIQKIKKTKKSKKSKQIKRRKQTRQTKKRIKRNNRSRR